MNDEPRTIRVDQGSQPSFGRVKVGIMIAGLKEGVPTTRVAVRSPELEQVVDLVEGESFAVAGRGTLTAKAVHPRQRPDGRDAVTLQWEPAVAGA